EVVALDVLGPHQLDGDGPLESHRTLEAPEVHGGHSTFGDLREQLVAAEASGKGGSRVVASPCVHEPLLPESGSNVRESQAAAGCSGGVASGSASTFKRRRTSSSGSSHQSP